MLIKSTILAQASGSLAGSVYARNAGGMYVRSRGTVINPNTVLQQQARIYLSQAAAAWQNTATAQQRADWTAWAINQTWTNRLGDPITLTGQQAYIRLNSLRLRAGLAMSSAAPTANGLASATPPVATVTAASPATLSIAFTNTDDWASASGGALLLFASLPVPPTINYFRGPYFYLTKILGAGTPPSSPVTPTYPAAAVAGQVVKFRAVALDTDFRVSADILFEDAAA